MGKMHKKYRTFWTPTVWREYCESNSFRRYRLARHHSLVIDFLKPRRGDAILEAGCGYGRITETLVTNEAEVVGIDISESMIAYCLKRFTTNFKGLVVDITYTPFNDAAFDKVLCNGVLMHVEDPEGVVKELVRVLKPGGLLLIDGNNLFSPFNWYEQAMSKWWELRGYEPQMIMRRKSPLFYKQILKRAGCRVVDIACDSLLVVDVYIPKIGWFAPPWLVPLLGVFDRLSRVTPFRHFGFEVWFLAKRV